MKSVELRLYEAGSLIEELVKALDRQRGGGTPLNSKEFLTLRQDALTWVRANKPPNTTVK